MTRPTLRSMISEATARLIGVWSITEFKDRDDEASEWTSYGSDPHGIIIYDATGTISVHLVADGPRPSTIGYIGYWGRFRMIEAEAEDDGFVGTLEHHMDGGSMPELFEDDVKRQFSLHGDRLVLGDGRFYHRVLERIV